MGAKARATIIARLLEQDKGVRMDRISKIRLAKDETIESTVLLGTSQNWYDHIIVLTCSKYKVDPTEIKSLYLATKQLAAERSRENFHSVNKGSVVHEAGRILDTEAIKRRNTLNGRGPKPQIVAEQIVERRGKMDPGVPQNSRLPHKRKSLAAKGTFDPLTFDRYIAFGDCREAQGKTGSLEKLHLLAVFTDKAKKGPGREAYVILSKSKGRFEVYDSLYAVKERLYGKAGAKSKELALWTPDRYVALGNGNGSKEKTGSLEPHQVIVLKDEKEQTGTEAYVIISKVKGQNGKTREHGNFGECYANLDAVIQRLYGARAASKELAWSEGQSFAKAQQDKVTAV